jgi:penicillin-binding protein 1A
MTAYQITSMMEGVVQRGTGTAAKVLNRPVAGKTGTTNDYKDAWFVGFTPELAVGVYVGYDQPRSMGSSITGGTFAVPIFTQFMAKALAGKPATQFSVPPGMATAWIDPNSGVAAYDGGPAIEEAFKPGTGPNLMTSVIGLDVNTFDAIQRQQQMQEQYGGGFTQQPAPDGGYVDPTARINGTYVDPNAGRGGLF